MLTIVKCFIVTPIAVLTFIGPAMAQVPHAVSTVPSMNQLDVTKTTTISATFDVDINPISVTSASVVVHGSISGSHAGAISYNTMSRTITFVPTVGFVAGDVATVILTQGIQSTGGAPLARGYAWNFTIRATSGTGIFLPHVDYDAGDSTYGLAAGDFTGDGKLDIVATSSGGNSVAVLPGLGNGSFAFSQNYAVGTRPMDVCLADLDRDGDLDIASANQNTNTVSILKNNGAGLVVSNLTYATGTGPRAICVTDFNGDGNLDLATANQTAGTVSVLWNNGLGVFTTKTDFPSAATTMSIGAADFNNDGSMDIVTANWSGSGVCAVILNDGTGSFGAPSIVGYGGAIGVYPADVNHDGWVDLVEAGNGPDAVLITFNQGNGTFHANADGYYSVVGYPNAVVAADLQKDGDLDVASASSWQASGHFASVLRNDGSGTFSGRLDNEVDLGPYDIIAADLNNDGSIDLATANIAVGSVSILLNGCCEGTTGNVNATGIVDLSDLSALVSYLTGGGYVLPCQPEANINNAGIVDLSDLSALVSYLTGGGYALPNCP